MSLLSVSSIQNPAAGQPNILLNADGSVTLPVITGAAAPLQFQAGTLWFDTAGPALQIRNPANTAWLPLSSAQAATLAEAAAGTLTTVYSSPETVVPKDAAGMTGAAIIPSGTELQRPGTPVVGMQRYNTDSQSEEVYTGATSGWKKLAWDSTPATPPNLTYSANDTLDDGVYFCNDLTINAGVTLTSNGQVIQFICTGNVNIAGDIDMSGKGPAGGSEVLSNSLGPALLGGPGFNIGGGQIATGGKSYAAISSTLGSGGAGGTATTQGGGTVLSGAGGAGGGGILIAASGNIIVSGQLLANGAAATLASGGVGSFTVGGAGGGSGGVIVLESSSNITFSGTASVAGGSGGNGAFQAPYTGADGGGGGGGGIVILQAAGTFTNTGTITLTAGAVGATSGVAGAQGGGGGGGCGGPGGTATVAAQAGKFLTVGSPI